MNLIHRLFVLALPCALGACPGNEAGFDPHADAAVPADSKADQSSPQVDGGSPTLAAGAVPEYVEGQSVVLSYRLFELERNAGQLAAAILDAGAPRILLVVPSDETDPQRISAISKISDALGARMSRVALVSYDTTGSDDNDPSVWARDWSPLSRRDASSFELVDFEYYSERPIDERAAAAIASTLNQHRTQAPMHLEGGNFMNDSRGHCFSTMRTLDSNDAITRNEVEAHMREALGCTTTTFFPNGIDSTYHIDMWAKLVSDDTVIVSEVWDRTLDAIADDVLWHDSVMHYQTYLDERAAEFAALGYRVIRVPMPAPFQKYGLDMVRSYTNSLQIGTTVLVPAFREPSVQFTDGALNTDYETAVQEAYESAGLSVVFIDSSDTIRARGAIHCTTMQLLE